MIGAGPLARMTHHAAIDLDVDLVVLAESSRDSAVTGGASYRLGSASCLADIRAVAGGADVVTFGHELVPHALLVRLEELGHCLRPASSALHLAQDRIEAHTVLSTSGFPVPAFATVSSPRDVAAFAEARGWPVVLKRSSVGHGGRGVHVIESASQAAALFASSLNGDATWLVEEFIDIAAELVVLIARTVSGRVALYPVVQMVYQDGICRYLLMPAPVAAPVADRAGRMAKSIADGIDATGMLAVEMFLDTDGRLLVSDVALRPHRAGYATLEACETSQFHQHLRAVLDWPLGAPTLRAAAATVNLIGDLRDAPPSSRLLRAVGEPNVHVHLYDAASRSDGQVGHVTALALSTTEALSMAEAVAAELVAS